MKRKPAVASALAGEVGATGFEPATSSSRTNPDASGYRAALRHLVNKILQILFVYVLLVSECFKVSFETKCSTFVIEGSHEN